MVTFTAGITAPVASYTVPANEPLTVETWQSAGVENASKSSPENKARILLLSTFHTPYIRFARRYKTRGERALRDSLVTDVYPKPIGYTYFQFSKLIRHVRPERAALKEVVTGTVKDVRPFLHGEMNLSAGRGAEFRGHVFGLDHEFFHAIHRRGDGTSRVSDLAGEHTRARNL